MLRKLKIYSSTYIWTPLNVCSRLVEIQGVYEVLNLEIYEEKPKKERLQQPRPNSCEQLWWTLEIGAFFAWHQVGASLIIKLIISFTPNYRIKRKNDTSNFKLYTGALFPVIFKNYWGLNPCYIFTTLYFIVFKELPFRNNCSYIFMIASKITKIKVKKNDTFLRKD